MSINFTENIAINTDFEIAQVSGGRGVKSQKKSFFNVFLGYLPNTKATFTDQARVQSEERKLMLNHLMERLRADSEAKQHELLGKIMQSDKDEKPYDVFGKCLEIARRIMRGEKVSADEMRFLARYFPELLFQALLLRQEDKDTDEGDRLSDDDDGLRESVGISEGVAMANAE